MAKTMGAALIPVASAADLERESQRRNTELQASPVIQGLAGHVRKRWEVAKSSRRDLEERMLQCVRQRNGEYDPEIKAQIRQQGGSDIFVRLTSVKCRAATSWLRDTLLGSGSDKPWSIDRTPEPELPGDLLEQLKLELQQQLQAALESGMPMPDEGKLREIAESMKDEAFRAYAEQADQRVERMERKMEDQLAEGGWQKAFNEFLDDIVTFPFACLKGPVKRRRKVLKWVEGELQPEAVIRNEWERVDPFMIYWAPWAADINDGFIIERHKMTRDELQSLIGVPGYNEDAIRAVLDEFSSGSISNDWLWIDSATAYVEDKSVSDAVGTPDLIDAIQLWDSVDGKLLIEWGLSEEEVEDPSLSYPCEVWLIGNQVIRAVLNYDPIGRKPYYITSYESKPGSVAGNGVADLARDSQAMVNASARALANNMGISSGPQVGVNVSRLPPGEDISDLHPWKIWQFQSSEFNDGSAPLEFFQPNSNARELMSVFDQFSNRADEDTMIPKYMTGGSAGGAGRTSSGLSMMISNAGKGIKQVINNIDKHVIVPAIERLYQDNIRYSEDPAIIGDVQIVAKGASSLVVKEAEAIRRNEFLQMVLNSPMASQVVGTTGAAELLRDAAKNLNVNVDRIVPNRGQMTIVEQQQQQIALLQQQLQALSQMAGNPLQGGTPPEGSPVAPPPPNPTQTQPDGAPVGGMDGNYMRNVATGGNG
jgi:hypothetical protein